MQIPSIITLFCRFGVIHSVFTNLLLWTNGVLTESKHQLNEHKERLITLGFGNITIGKMKGWYILEFLLPYKMLHLCRIELGICCIVVHGQIEVN